MKSAILPKALLLLFSLALAHLSSQAGYVILISCDGTRPDAITACGPDGAPTFHRLRAEGAFTDNARTDPGHTTTLQNHTNMITGRPVEGPQGHQWIDNGNPKLGDNLHRNHKSYLTSVFDVAHDNGLKTALFGSKTKFSLYDISYDGQRGAVDKTGPDNGRDKIDVCLVSGATVALVNTLIGELTSDSPPQFTMLHLSNPDSAGHDYGWNISSKHSEYMKSIKMVDSLIGRVLACVESSRTLNGKTTLIVTADHGGRLGTKGHEESAREDNYRIPFYIWGPGVQGGADLYSLNPASRRDPGHANPGEGPPPIRNGEAGNLALQILGLPPIPGSTLNAKQDLVFGGSPVNLTTRSDIPLLQAVPIPNDVAATDLPRIREVRAIPLNSGD